MIDGSGRGRMVLVVEPDLGFADTVRALLERDRVVASRSMAEAAAIAEGRMVDVAIVGPSFGTEDGAASAAALREADPSLLAVLVADVPANRVLRAAMRAGLADVIDAPLTARKLGEALHRTDAIDAARAVPVVLEPEAAETPAAAPEPAPPPSEPEPVPDPAAPGDGGSHPGADTPDLDVPLFAAVVTDGPDDEEPAVLVETEPAAPPLPAEPILPAPPPIEDEPLLGWAPPIPAQDAPYAPPPMPPAFVPEDAAGAEPLMPAAFVPEDAAGAEPPMPMERPPMPAGLPPSAPDFEPDAPEAETAPAPPAFEPVATGQLPPVPAGIPPLDAREERAPEQAAGPSLGAGVPRPRVRPGAGKVLTVMAGKGGSGKTITATNLAMALTEAAGPGRVVIVDADLQFGDVALLLQVDPVRTIVDAAARLDDLGGDEMDALLLHHPSGLRVLPAPLLPAAGEEIGAKHVVRVVEILRDMFPYVVVDTGPVFDDGLITLLEHSDHVLLVVDMDLPSVKNAKIALDTLRASRFEMGRIHLTVNRANSKARLDLTELERALGEQVDGAIPSDRLIPQSVNEGVPAVAFSPRSRVAKAFHELAEAFLDR